MTKYRTNPKFRSYLKPAQPGHATDREDKFQPDSIMTRTLITFNYICAE